MLLSTPMHTYYYYQPLLQYESQYQSMHSGTKTLCLHNYCNSTIEQYAYYSRSTTTVASTTRGVARTRVYPYYERSQYSSRTRVVLLLYYSSTSQYSQYAYYQQLEQYLQYDTARILYESQLVLEQLESCNVIRHQPRRNQPLRRHWPQLHSFTCSVAL